MKYVLVFLLSFNAFSQVKYIDKDVPAPYNGFLFTISKTKEVRKELIEKDKLTIFNKALRENIVKYETVITNQENQVKMLKEQNTKLAKDLDQDKSMTNFQRALWFGLGIAAAGFAVYGASQIAK